MAEEGNKIVLYTTDDGRAQVSLMSRDGRIWLNQKQMAELFAVTKPNISMLVAKIFMGKELDDSVICRGGLPCTGRRAGCRRSRRGLKAKISD